MESELLTELDRDGIVRLPDLLSERQLRDMQTAFAARLRRMRWNDTEGYEKTERYRHMVQDVLTLAQGFVDLALHPVVQAILRTYIGPGYQLVEAKGWQSLPTRGDFHGWHGDEWYDQTIVGDIPREVKMAVYLTDVKTGAFHYVRRSHRQRAPHILRTAEVAAIPRDRVVEMTGPAGAAFLFDTTGIHRQGMPILEPREAVFLSYRDPAVPLSVEDREGYRYYPLLLSAAFLGGLSEEECRVLGFGDKRHYQHAFARGSSHTFFEQASRVGLEATLRVQPTVRRIFDKLRRRAAR